MRRKQRENKMQLFKIFKNFEVLKEDANFLMKLQSFAHLPKIGNVLAESVNNVKRS